MKKLSTLCVLVCLAVHVSLFSKAIIFDLGDTLIKRDTMKIASHVGYWNGFWMWLAHGGETGKRTGDLLMSVLADGTEVEDPIVVLDAGGRVMPRILREWFMGVKTCAEVKAYGLERVQQFNFERKRELAMTQSTIEWMFTPELFAQSHSPVEGGLKLLAHLRRLKDSSCKPLHTLYIISNYDPESYAILRQHMPELFKFFDENNIVVSGLVGDMKPHHSIFTNFMAAHKLAPEDCVFIDDQAENIESARACGMSSIHIVDHNFKQVRHELVELGVLPGKKFKRNKGR